MALSRPREHQIGGGHHYAQSASSSSHHGHHHHHHHHRSKPRRTFQAQGGGPLRQLQDQYEEAMALGGGSSRDASEVSRVRGRIEAGMADFWLTRAGGQRQLLRAQRLCLVNAPSAPPTESIAS